MASDLKPHDRIIFPLDNMDLERATAMIDKIGGHVGAFKIGLEFFIRYGRSAFDLVREYSEARIMLDLKLHDIPKTVGRAMAAAAAYKPWLITVHASGHEDMLHEAIKNRGQSLVAGVTVLTSLDERACRETYGDSPTAKVIEFARMLARTGCDAIVCSPKELEAIKEINDEPVQTMFRVIPGIRPTWAVPAGQTRFTTPAQAIKAGADFLVIGDPIASHTDPIDACILLRNEIREALEEEAASG